MPIYEFRCLNCNECFELLVMKNEEGVELRCPACHSETFERIMSVASHQVGDGSKGQGVSKLSRNCSSGSCTTYEIPGHTS
ncbi:MAG: zinc ribbon domain-containing protein [Desulfobacterales bacterium]